MFQSLHFLIRKVLVRVHQHYRLEFVIFEFRAFDQSREGSKSLGHNKKRIKGVLRKAVRRAGGWWDVKDQMLFYQKTDLSIGLTRLRRREGSMVRGLEASSRCQIA